MNNSFKLGCGMVISLTLGLSGCYMDSPFSGNTGSTSKPTMTTSASNPQQGTPKTEKKQAAKEPIQQTTPGPKRTAAPQIPVIQ